MNYAGIFGRLCVLEERRGVKNIEFLRSGSLMLCGSACWFTSLHCNGVNGAMGPGNVASRVHGFLGSREKIYNCRMGLIERIRLVKMHYLLEGNGGPEGTCERSYLEHGK